ncbi:MAG: hypothetical protein RLN62_00655 [Rickettsiales bacterium]
MYGSEHTSKNKLENLSSLGHLGNLKEEEVLQIGVSGDILKTIEQFTQGGMFRIMTRNFEGVYTAFSQLKLYPLTLDDALPLNVLGTISPPKPHLGIIDRKSKQSRVWIGR